MRHSNTERRGVNAVESAFINDLDWIFREQPIADVGIDAFVEKKDNGIPAGKFMALQIKSGEGNFKVKSDRLTYYVSNIHYHYWLNLNLPIVLVAYLPTDGKCYWQRIVEKNIVKTKSRWKIDIPKNNVINRKARLVFDAILQAIDTEDVVSDLYSVEVGEPTVGIDLLHQSIQCTGNINRIIAEFGTSFKASKTKNDHLISEGHGLNSAVLNSALKKQSQGIAVQSKRLEAEVTLFSEVFSSEIFELEQYIYSWLKNTKNIPGPFSGPLRQMPVKLEYALLNFEKFKSDAIGLSAKVPQLKKAITSLSNALELLCDEYRVALGLVSSMNQGLDKSAT